MKSIAQEAEEQLDALLRRYDREPPREAILQLFLLALKREEVVSIGYRDSLIALAPPHPRRLPNEGSDSPRTNLGLAGVCWRAAADG